MFRVKTGKRHTKPVISNQNKKLKIKNFFRQKEHLIKGYK